MSAADRFCCIHRARERVSGPRESDERRDHCVYGQAAGNRRLPLAALMCAWGVSRAWREAVARALLHQRSIDFPSNVKGADVLTMLKRVAGKTLKTVCLEGCRKLTGDDAARILVRVAGRGRGQARWLPREGHLTRAGYCRQDASRRWLAC